VELERGPKKAGRFIRPLLPARHAPSIPLPLLSYTMSGALLMLLKRWFDRGMPHPPEEMDAFFQQHTMESVRKAIP
jgi:hypothetical protein